MQIKIHLNDCNASNESSENVVQKILAASNTRQNEMQIVQREEWMYFQISSMSYCKVVHKNHRQHWSLCSIDKFKLHCLYLITYLLVNLYLLLKHGWTLFYGQFSSHCICMCYAQLLVENCTENHFKRISSVWLQKINHYHNSHHHHHHHPAHTSPVIIETSLNKSLMNDKDFMLLLNFTPPPHLKTQTTTTSTFYNFLLNSFYVKFKSHQFRRYQQQQHQLKFYFNSNSSINKFCDLSTNDFGINEMIYLKCGIEHYRWHVVKPSSLTTDKLRNGLKRLNSFFYGILLIQRHLTFNNHEFSDNHHERIGESVKHQLLHHFLAHNQMILHVTVPAVTISSFSMCHSHHLLLLAFYSTDNCHTTHSIENGISTLGTSNHKLKMSQSDNDVYNHHHQPSQQKEQHQTHKTDEESVKYSNCFQHLHRPAFRSNDGAKSHLNAILFLVILCIPLLTSTAASNVHNLKYSTNVVKTKYGLLRGIILRQNPTVEGYLGVPYGKF